MRWLSRTEIETSLDVVEALLLQEKGFVAYSTGRVAMPPVVHFTLGTNSAEVHVKCGWICDEEFFAVKVAGGFADNPSQNGLSTVQGAILLFSARTGQLAALLEDGGYLTSMRTAMAGAIAAKYLSPDHVPALGVIGTGIQARLQAKFLREITSCNELWVWGRSRPEVVKYTEEMEKCGFHVFCGANPSEVANHSNLIITATSSCQPLLSEKEILPGTLILAVGADAPGKQELDPRLFQRAERVVADSRCQSLDHGEAQHAYQMGLLRKESVEELGEVILRGREPVKGAAVTIVDLTGLGIQDLQIALSVLMRSASNIDVGMMAKRMPPEAFARHHGLHPC